jgi:hypothetical protein
MCYNRDSTGAYYECYWNNVGCTALGKDESWYNCFWNEDCPEPEAASMPENDGTWESYLECQEALGE